MAKRKIPPNTPTLDLMPEPESIPKWNATKVLKLAERPRASLSPQERELFLAVALLIRTGLLPNDYEILFNLLKAHKSILISPSISPENPAESPESPATVRTDTPQAEKRKRSKLKEKSPLPSSETNADPAPLFPGDGIDLPFTFDP